MKQYRLLIMKLSTRVLIKIANTDKLCKTDLVTRNSMRTLVNCSIDSNVAGSGKLSMLSKLFASAVPAPGTGLGPVLVLSQLPSVVKRYKTHEITSMRNLKYTT